MQIHQPQTIVSCPTCLLAFSDAETHKQHYKSDFHRYNLKRKMVKLPPATFMQFSTKLKQTPIKQTQQLTCNQCRKKFNSINTLNQHLVSKGHDQHKIISREIISQKHHHPFEKNHKKCIFCEQLSKDLDTNEAHMQSQHSFFVPQRGYCINVKGLLEYLQQKVQIGAVCLFCNNAKTKDFQTGQAVKKHMIDKGHTFMKTENGYEQYQQFYNFSALFDAKIKQQKDKVVIGIDYQDVKVIVNDQEDWEDVNSQEWESQQDQQDQQDQQAIKENAKNAKVKTYHIMKPTLTINDQLLLPNGNILGHRKYRYLYNQTLRLPNYFINNLKQLSNGEQRSLIDRNYFIRMINQQKVCKSDLKRRKRLYLNQGLTNNGLQKHFRERNTM